MISQSRTYAPGYGNFSLGGAELEKVKKESAYSSGSL